MNGYKAFLACRFTAIFLIQSGHILTLQKPPVIVGWEAFSLGGDRERPARR